MFPFSSNKDDRNLVPSWADFFSAEEYLEFEKALGSYFDSLGKPFKIDDGTVRTNWMAGDGGLQNLGLLNVAQMCKQGKLRDYPGIIRNHFEVMRKSKDFIAGFFDNMNDFEFV
ncbi:MAG TPA: hypothetical protein VHS96_02805, partial [Bacteroidia bacterium]|nr:hypothetical protein [Bacteroidia bacterium]